MNKKKCLIGKKCCVLLLFCFFIVAFRPKRDVPHGVTVQIAGTYEDQQKIVADLAKHLPLKKMLRH